MYGLAEDLKLSALGRQPEDILNSIITEAMIQVWGCSTTSPVRYQRIDGMCLFWLKHNSSITTDT
ncbi:hypothetical protein Hanom_Chr09g00785231 [Helianthus anomalus]